MVLPTKVDEFIPRRQYERGSVLILMRNANFASFMWNPFKTEREEMRLEIRIGKPIVSQTWEKLASSSISLDF